MSIDFIKDLKYLNTVFTVVNKNDVNNPFYVYIDIIENDQLAIFEEYSSIQIENPDNYRLIESIMSNDIDDVLCDICDSNKANMIRNQKVYCDDCKDIKQISPSVFKFMNKNDLEKILRSLDNSLEILDEHEKGLVVTHYDSDYDHNHVIIIKSEDIGEF